MKKADRLRNESCDACSSNDLHMYNVAYAHVCALWNDVCTKRFFTLLSRVTTAVLLTIATCVTFFFVPLDKAHAAQVWWDYAGNGYVTAEGYWVGDALRDISMEYPQINYNAWDPATQRTRTQITWQVTFNAKGLLANSISSGQFPKRGQSTDGSAWEGRPYLYAWLPSGIDQESIRITREATKRESINIHEADWGYTHQDQTIHNFGPRISNWTYQSGDRQFDSDWNNSLGPGTGTIGVGGGIEGDYAKQYNMCEVYKWKQGGEFSRVFFSWEKSTLETSYRWTITAFVDEQSGKDPLKMPFAAGWRSNHSRKNKFVLFGPFDSDGDGFPDYWEHTHHTNPTDGDELKYPSLVNGQFIDGRDAYATYGSPVTIKPYMRTGEWVGNTAEGHFQYDGKTTDELPIAKDLDFTINSNSIPSGVRQVSSKNNMQPGDVYIDKNSGQITYMPRKDDKRKTLNFQVSVIYPNPAYYNCKKAQVRTNKTVTIKVRAMSQLYNPVYDTTTVRSDQEAQSPAPKDANNSNRPLPKGTTIKIQKYNNSDDPLSWSSVSQFNSLKVFFSPKNRGVTPKKYKTPVLVTYPDGSTSADNDSATKGKPVYAPVNVTPAPISKGDLHLNLHKGRQNGQLGEYIADGSTIKLIKNKTMTPDIWLDSWLSGGAGRISLRTLCYEEVQENGKTVHKNYQFGGINGLTLTPTHQWEHADDAEEKRCANGNCNWEKYLYQSESVHTKERSRAQITGRPKKNGNFVCIVYALGDTRASGFDALEKLHTVSPIMTENPISLPANEESATWITQTVRLSVHSMAHYYNPKYETTTVTAGTKSVSAVPKSARNANEATRNQDAVNEGALPDGTWFELKKYAKQRTSKEPLQWADFENGQSNAPDNTHEDKGKHSADGDGGNYGKVTFAPNKWEDKKTHYEPVIVHYPDGSTSEDADSGNLGKPVYAPVKVESQTVTNPDLTLKAQRGYWGSDIGKNGIDAEPGKPLDPNVWLDSWSTHKPGKIHHRVICHKKNADGTSENYSLSGINGMTLQDEKQWKHASYEQQKDCRKKNKCNPGDYLYDDDVEGGGSRNTTERTQSYIKGTPKDAGDFECTVYALKILSEKRKNNLVTKFDTYTRNLSKDPENALANLHAAVLTNETAKNPADDAREGVDWARVTFQIHVHKQAHYYNPSYKPVSVNAGNKVVSPRPISEASANGVENNNPRLITGDLPAGTWFEIKKYSKHRDSKEPLQWAYFADKQSNAPEKGKGPQGKDTTSEGAFGKVTFYPDVSVEHKAYQTPVIVHYPDGSTSEDPDSGNFGKPVYANVTVNNVNYTGNDLRMTLTKSQDVDSALTKNDKLVVMSSMSLVRKPFVRAWSVKDKGKIHLRMMCTKNGENKWSRGLDHTLNMHLANNYGENSPAWTFATSEQMKQCRENGKCDADHVVYGLTRNTPVESFMNATARREENVEGAPIVPGEYTCTVYALKDNALTAFNNAVNNNLIENNTYTSANMQAISLTGTTSHKDWERITFGVHVVERFKLPKTGEVNWNMLMGVVSVIGTGLMAIGFFLDQSKWARALLKNAGMRAQATACSTACATACSTAVRFAHALSAIGGAMKDFICKTAEKLKALRQSSERWRC